MRPRSSTVHDWKLTASIVTRKKRSDERTYKKLSVQGYAFTIWTWWKKNIHRLGEHGSKPLVVEYNVFTLEGVAVELSAIRLVAENVSSV